MLEQKLFFTRNGEYTLWEKLSLINKSTIIEIKNYLNQNIEENMLNDLKKRSDRSFIFNAYNILEDGKKEEFDQMLNRYFIENPVIGSDFNGIIYKIDINFMSLENIEEKLKKIDITDEISKCRNTKIDIYTNKNNCYTDIKVSSIKAIEYKESMNELIINTEIRIYHKLGLMMVTDYNDYTHSKNCKNELIKKINLALNNKEEELMPYKLSDIALRILLNKSKTNASKIKFSVAKGANLTCTVDDEFYDNALDIREFRNIYNNHSLFGIKIAMDKNQEKYINVDGEKGKLISRTKNIEVNDIDEFITLVSEIIKYDYLNMNYRNIIFDKARMVVVGPSARLKGDVDEVLLGVKRKFEDILKDKFKSDEISIIINAFLYCLIKGIKGNSDVKAEYSLPSKVISRITKFFEISNESLINIYNTIIDISMKKQNDNIVDALDDFIKSKEVVYANTI